MKNTDKEAKSFKIFSYVTLFITGFYSFAHFIYMIICSEPIVNTDIFETVTSTFLDVLFSLDLLSWFIYIPFAIIVVIVQILYLAARFADTENVKKWFYLPSFLNIIFGVYSIYGIFQLFERAF